MGENRLVNFVSSFIVDILGRKGGWVVAFEVLMATPLDPKQVASFEEILMP